MRSLCLQSTHIKCIYLFIYLFIFLFIFFIFLFIYLFIFLFILSLIYLFNPELIYFIHCTFQLFFKYFCGYLRRLGLEIFEKVK